MTTKKDDRGHTGAGADTAGRPYAPAVSGPFTSTNLICRYPVADVVKGAPDERRGALHTLDLHEEVEGYPWDTGAYLITEDGLLKKNSVREIEPPPADLRHKYRHYEGRYFEDFIREVHHTGDVWFGTHDLDEGANPYLCKAVFDAGRVVSVTRVRYPFYTPAGQIQRPPYKISAQIIARQLSSFIPGHVGLGIASFRNADRAAAESEFTQLFGHPGYICGFTNWGLSWLLAVVPLDRPEAVDLDALRGLLGAAQSKAPKGRIGDCVVLFTGQDYECYRRQNT